MFFTRGKKAKYYQQIQENEFDAGFFHAFILKLISKDTSENIS